MKNKALLNTKKNSALERTPVPDRGMTLRPILKFSFFLLVPFLYLLFFWLRLGPSFMDDAYISFRYLENFLAGEGLTFNPPQRIEGFTNLGWVLFLAPFDLIFDIPVAAKILSFLLTAFCFLISFFLARRLYPQSSSWWTFVLPCLLAAQFDFLLFSASGMETALLAALLLSAAWLILTEKNWLLSALLSAFAFLVHPEAGLVFPLFTFIIFVVAPAERKKLLLPLILFVLLLFTFSLARFLYFSDWLPHTFSVKKPALRHLPVSLYALMKGANKNASFPLNNLAGLVFCLFGVLWAARSSKPGAAYLAASAMTGLIFAIYAPADWTGRARYFAPYAPAGLILFWLGLAEAQEKILTGLLSFRSRQTLLALWAVLLSGVGGAESWLYLRPSYTERYPGYVLFARSLITPSLWIRDHTPTEALIATRRIGALGYYSRRRIFDYKFGLVDREIAALRRQVGEEFSYPSHPALAEVWHRRAPEYLLEDGPIIEVLRQESGEPDGDFWVHGIPYREVKRFLIGEKMEWVFCERVREELK